ncbi:Dipeptidyl carboxypeptidase Dcp [Lysobacter dokdonensis DS-58]|uniref:Dipeptidyl carboxypeptidase Dcp n=1 Tax=Lysobacter dokdonensis DS-58 TaxID=1300345 RepID=A0A0A2WJU1_9GAMM|nr:Dipeptidyl carboxypeptidase Dcp [Lysobacter dokdonensis DS-58]
MQNQTANPFFADSTLPLHYPDFAKIQDTDFGPAFDQGMKEELAEIERIANNKAKPTFDNTILAMEKNGRTLTRAATVFYNLFGADKNDAREKIDEKYSPIFAAHRDTIRLNPKLFARIKSLYDRRAKLGLDAQQTRLVERYYTDFVRAGAKLNDADKTTLKDINAQLATLGTQFEKKLIDGRNAAAVVVDSRAELDGLSDAQIDAAADVAKTRGLDGKFVLTILNTTGQPPAAQLTNRALREKLYRASMARGDGGEFDTTAIISQVVKLRAQKAKLLGYANWAAFVLEDETAKTPQAVNDMLGKLAPPAVANARREAADLQAMIDKEQAAKGQPTFKLEPWDWSFYSEKVRKAKFAFDENELKPYLELDNVQQNGVFYAAHELYGLSFKERKDLPVYEPDVRVFDVFDKDGKQLAIFISDMYARDSKQGGAWMNSYVDQSALTGFLPVVANHLNITKPPAGQPTLLTWDEVTTMFHEFGHALHGMFSNVEYPYFTGTNVPRDFVEYPSQVNEMWADWPSVLANYAKHHETGKPMPKELLDKVLAAGKFNQGFTTTEYLGAALLDQKWHQITPDQVPPASGVMAFEAAALKKDGVDFAAVPPRYKTPYFSHIMGGYSAGYYAYIWSEVLDADTVEWIKKNGGLTRANGDHFRDTLLSRGGSKDALQLFQDFAGRKPEIGPLLKRRGLDAPAADDSKQPAEAKPQEKAATGG